ncbi:MAG: SMP-30/gluconolactonase/LRE family protein, partial [Rufibacter sp.]
MNWETVTDHCSYLGEGPVWDTARGRLLWVDIEPGQVHQYTPATGEHRIFKADQ